MNNYILSKTFKKKSYNDTQTESDNDTQTESDNDTQTESDNNLLCKCCNLIEYETEDTINFIKQLDNETLTKYVYRLNKEIIELREAINRLNVRVDNL